MTKFSDITFTMTDVIKGIALVALIVPMWIDLRTDRIKMNSKIDFLQYQVNELKQICGVLPKETKLENGISKR